MSSSADLYLDEIRTDLLEQSDPSVCELLFAKGEYVVRARGRAHAEVRACLRRAYEGEVEEYLYLRASAATVRERLAIQGYTAPRLEVLWEQARRSQLEGLRSLMGRFDAELLAEELHRWEELTYGAWQTAMEQDARAKFEGGDVRQSKIDLEALFREEALWDPLAVLALQLDALKPAHVWADLTQIYSAWGFDPRLTPHENFQQERAPFSEPADRIVILTEGKTDQRALSAALHALFPEFADAYQFDFETFRIEGGASPLARMVKLFAGVRVQTRMLAIFDNDAAGAEALKSLGAINLPDNLRTMSLPDLELARRYPTEGPEGLRLMDVNGRACAIEMFFGRQCLTGSDGRLRPVRWSQWNQGAGRYQGELMGKTEVSEKFMDALAGKPAALRRKFPQMCQLLDAIFAAFKT